MNNRVTYGEQYGVSLDHESDLRSGWNQIFFLGDESDLLFLGDGSDLVSK